MNWWTWTGSCFFWSFQQIIYFLILSKSTEGNNIQDDKEEKQRPGGVLLLLIKKRKILNQQLFFLSSAKWMKMLSIAICHPLGIINYNYYSLIIIIERLVVFKKEIWMKGIFIYTRTRALYNVTYQEEELKLNYLFNKSSSIRLLLYTTVPY